MEFFITLESEVFPGFYNTYLDPNEINEEVEATEEMFNNIKQEICNYLTDVLQENCPFHIVSSKIWSPITYNNSNDTFDMVIETTPEAIMYEILTSDYLDDIRYSLSEDSSKIFSEVLTALITFIADEHIEPEELYTIVLNNVDNGY